MNNPSVMTRGAIDAANTILSKGGEVKIIPAKGGIIVKAVRQETVYKSREMPVDNAPKRDII